MQRLGSQVLIKYLSHLHYIHHFQSVLNSFISGPNFTAAYADAEENILENKNVVPDIRCLLRITSEEP